MGNGRVGMGDSVVVPFEFFGGSKAFFLGCEGFKLIIRRN